MAEVGPFTRLMYDDGETDDFSSLDYPFLKDSLLNWTERSIDKLIEIDTVNGVHTSFPASTIRRLALVTPESRAAWYERDASFNRDEESMKVWSPDAT